MYSNTRVHASRPRSQPRLHARTPGRNTGILLNETAIATNNTPSLSFFNDHNPCTTGRLGQRTAFGWMGYTVRVHRYRYTIWLVWDGHAQQADWSQVAGRELYV